MERSKAAREHERRAAAAFPLYQGRVQVRRPPADGCEGSQRTAEENEPPPQHEVQPKVGRECWSVCQLHRPATYSTKMAWLCVQEGGYAPPAANERATVLARAQNMTG